MSDEEAVVWLIIIIVGFRFVKAMFAPDPPKAARGSRGLIRTYIAAREQTRAKRKLAEDRERRAEKRKRREHQALMRGEKKRAGNLWSILFD